MLGLLLGLIIILVSCEVFTNGIEWLGKSMRVGDGAVGSILSAVGTCLPETIIPIIAILFFGSSPDTDHISIGAIAGAPFMLCTLAFFVTGLSVFAFRRKRKSGLAIHANISILRRDLCFFIMSYSIGILASFVELKPVRYSIAVFLILYYVTYVVLTVSNDRVDEYKLDKLYLSRYFGVRPGKAAILVQVAAALAGTVFGAQIFVVNMDSISKLLGISSLILSFIITPVATELPEKFNSIIWISKRKDTLALGNITGAMVFQSCIPVSIGILATTWKLDARIVLSAVLALFSVSVTYLWLKLHDRLSPFPLLTGGIFYIIFIYFLLTGNFI
jgi:cation:H+ antiporter